MRFFLSTLTILTALILVVLVQAQPPQQDPSGNNLDSVLQSWEQAMSGINSLVAQCTRTEIDKTFQAKELYEGTARYLKTKYANLASLEMKKKSRPEVFEKFICTGTYFYQFMPQQKKVLVREMPKPKEGQVSDNNLLSFLFGMKAAEAKLRYDLSFIPPPANDRWYFYIDIRPKSPQDKADFTRARMVLLRNSFMPRQLWFEESNGNEIIWDFPRVNINEELSVQDFAPPKLPAGWEYVRVQPENQPRILRNQQP